MGIPVKPGNSSTPTVASLYRLDNMKAILSTVMILEKSLTETVI